MSITYMIICIQSLYTSNLNQFQNQGWKCGEREREDYDDDGVEGGGGLKNTFYLVFFPCFCVSERLGCDS